MERKRQEKAAFSVAFILGLAAVSVALGGWISAPLVHGRMAETGGWTPENLQAEAGVPLTIRLTSDDVLHGFAVGQMDMPPVDVLPGEVTEVTLNFERPGRYTFYCTRWCSVNHWRMRGVIEVSPHPGPLPEGEGESPHPGPLPEGEGESPHPGPAVPSGALRRQSAPRGGEALTPAPLPKGEGEGAPLYVQQGIDLDAPRAAGVPLPQEKPSARRGQESGLALPDVLASREYYLTHSPAQAYQDLKAQPGLGDLTDQQLWDLAALAWAENITAEGLENGRKLYAANCAACHGEGGVGDGVFAEKLSPHPGPAGMSGPGMRVDGAITQAPTDFTDANRMLAASPALLQGKILRGGMGTGMPNWGPIFTEEQIWDLVAFLWSFQMELGK